MLKFLSRNGAFCSLIVFAIIGSFGCATPQSNKFANRSAEESTQQNFQSEVIDFEEIFPNESKKTTEIVLDLPPGENAEAEQDFIDSIDLDPQTQEKSNLIVEERLAPDESFPVDEATLQTVAETQIQEGETEPLAPQPSNQELIDSALDYWQTSNDFWEQGDLENAIDALDKAYSLILQVEEEETPELAQQKEDLRITISRRVVEVYASRSTVANGTHTAIPLEMNKHVQKAINLFTGRERKFFLEAYVRSGKHRPAIVRALKEAGLPEELSWLPLIESGYKIRALSSARALGMWQFIASTGYKFGLKRDSLIDERMDPAKSTGAAVAYLTELHNIFGDWTTALAAYNCGENRVLRKIKSQKISYLDNFWDLYRKLPSETAFYVPKFLAVLHIVKNPQAHGFDELPPVADELVVDTVSINKQAKLQTIAKKINIPYKELRNLNPELRKGVTPKGIYSLNVTQGTSDFLLAKINEIPTYTPPTPLYIVHKVRRGESLSVIADRYKTSVTAIVRVNNLRSKSFIRKGWKLKVPTSRRAANKLIASTTPVRSKSANPLQYVVKKGDSLWKIANKYKATVNSIKALNGLKKSSLHVGQVLTLSSTTRPATAPQGRSEEYHVRKGDSPYRIAKRFNMGLSDFLALNSLTPQSTIYPNQKVVVQKKRM